jgi:hypothetical protein
LTELRNEFGHPAGFGAVTTVQVARDINGREVLATYAPTLCWLVISAITTCTHSPRLSRPRHQFQWLAAQQSRDNRHLALNRKALGAIPVDARRVAPASFGGALRRPFGLAPVIIRHV